MSVNVIIRGTIAFNCISHLHQSQSRNVCGEYNIGVHSSNPAARALSERSKHADTVHRTCTHATTLLTRGLLHEHKMSEYFYPQRMYCCTPHIAVLRNLCRNHVHYICMYVCMYIRHRDRDRSTRVMFRSSTTQHNAQKIDSWR